MYLRTAEDRAVGVRQASEPHVQHPGGTDTAWLYRSVSPVKLLFFQTGQVQRRPLAGIGGLRVLPVNLYVPDAAGQAGGRQLHRISHADDPFRKGAGDYGAEAVHGKDPVNGQTERRQRAFFFGMQHQ